MSTIPKAIKKTDSPVQPPAPVLVQQPQAPSLMNVVKEGFAFGVGSSVARNVIDRFMAPSQPPVKAIDTKVDKPEPFEYIQCMQDSAFNHEACKDYLQ
jgi:hypothetical protein